MTYHHATKQCHQDILSASAPLCAIAAGVGASRRSALGSSEEGTLGKLLSRNPTPSSRATGTHPCVRMQISPCEV